MQAVGELVQVDGLSIPRAELAAEEIDHDPIIDRWSRATTSGEGLNTPKDWFDARIPTASFPSSNSREVGDAVLDRLGQGLGHQRGPDVVAKVVQIL
jgi:hypothetical protein